MINQVVILRPVLDRVNNDDEAQETEELPSVDARGEPLRKAAVAVIVPPSPVSRDWSGDDESGRKYR